MNLHTGASMCPIPTDILCPTCHGKRTVLRKVSLIYNDADGDVVVQVEGGGCYRLGPHIHTVTPLPKCLLDASVHHCPGCQPNRRDYGTPIPHCEHCYLA